MVGLRLDREGRDNLVICLIFKDSVDCDPELRSFGKCSIYYKELREFSKSEDGDDVGKL